jgi:SAM-dependent methyltransferase
MAEPNAPTLAMFDRAMAKGRAESQAESLDFWNGRAKPYKKHQDKGANDAIHQKIVETIQRRAGLNKSHRVLDLGCGPGRHSRLFSKVAGRVTAFDLSPTMIELARAEKVPPGEAIDYEELDWDEADLKAKGWEGQFYLAFASRTPAIHDLASLRKMIRTVDRGFGALVSSVELYNGLRAPLTDRLGIEPEVPRAIRSVYLEINLLWLLGYFPEVTYFDQKWAARRPLEEAIFQQTRYFKLIKGLSDGEKALIAQSLAERAENGSVLEEVEAKFVLVIWEIPPRVTVDKVVTDEPE